ncbi:MAG: glycosyltransferase family 9 protein, partial [Acidobacteria bacterium]|nr:glycosyltransferase family 9 protein [Acidobacteriota bacterium]
MPNHASPQPFPLVHRPASIVVAQLAFIGDMVFTTPLLDALVERWPESAITVVGRAAALEVLAGDPRVRVRVPYEKSQADRGIGGLRRVAAILRAGRPELFLGVSRSARTSLLALRSGAPRRIGFAGPGQGLAYTHTVPREDTRRNFPARPLALLEPLLGPVAPRPLRLIVDEGRRRAAAERLTAAGWRGERLLAVAPGAHYATKRWPVERYASLLTAARTRGGFRPALYGGPAEAALLDALRAACPTAL